MERTADLGAIGTYRFTLDAQLADHHAAMTQHAHELMNHWSNDTTYEDVDSLRSVWQLVRTPAARYAEALTYLQQGNYASATTVVENIPVEHELKDPEMFERQRMLDVIGFCGIVSGTGRTLAELTTGEVDQLEGLVNGEYDRPAAWAQNLLCFVYSEAPLKEPAPKAATAAIGGSGGRSNDRPLLRFHARLSATDLRCAQRM